MSARNPTALVTDSFHDTTREHPAMRWMEKCKWLHIMLRRNQPSVLSLSHSGIDINNDLKAVAMLVTCAAFLSRARTNSLSTGKDWLNTTDRDQASHWFSPNFVYISPDGTEVTGGEPAWNKMFDEEYYAYFTKWHHEPYSIVCFETDNHGCEYEMVGQAQVYANLIGKSDGVPKVTNPKDGQEWDMVRPGAWHFWYEKTDDPKHEGYQLKRLHLMMDTGPVVARLMQKGDLDHTHLIDKHVTA